MVSCSVASPIIGFPLPSVTEMSTGTNRARGALGGAFAAGAGWAEASVWTAVAPLRVSGGAAVWPKRTPVRKQNTESKRAAVIIEVAFILPPKRKNLSAQESPEQHSIEASNWTYRRHTLPELCPV